MTIANMIPVELNMMSRSAAATGPFGSSTPSEQPASATALNRTAARGKYRISDPLGFGLGGTARRAESSIDRRDGSGSRSGARGERARPSIPAVAGQERREQHEQVKNRKREHAMCRPSFALAAPGQLQGEYDKRRTAHGGGRAVDCAGEAERPWQQRNGDQHNAVDEDLSCGFDPAGNHGKHGDAGTGIFVGAIERQRPEMRRRPKEHDQEQDDRLERDLTGGRRPADYGGKRAGSPADDDILRRASLEPYRVDDDVEEDRESEQCRCRDIEHESKHRNGTGSENHAEYERFCTRDRAARDRAAGGASHYGIDVGVVPHVEHTRGSGPCGDRENCNGSEEWIEAARRDHQSNERGEHRERHHAWLHQRDEMG